MSCDACEGENPPGNRFCGVCGAPLARRCAACQHANPPDHRFCGGCGAPLDAAPPTPRAAAGDRPAPGRDPRAQTPKHLADRILQSRSALEGERKQVTVLFADVKGSMELAEQLDPEEWSRIMQRFFSILADGVERFEGFVDKFTGDGIMALFGAPIAHEDHAQRACYAALHLQGELARHATEVKRAHGATLSTRIGLNSGEVVVGRIGDDLRMDYTALGHTVGLAQRMEQLAEPGAAYLTAHTARLVEGYFALHSLGDLAIKGAREPLGVYTLEGRGALHSRLEIAQARGFSKFVGRGDEVATLEAALERSLKGRGQTVGVVADAGTGKSRLCFEFLERCRARGFRVIAARGVAHGRNVPLLPMLGLFRSYFGVEQSDPDTTVREKIAGRLLRLDESLREDLPIFFNLLGVPDPDQPPLVVDPDALQRRTSAAIRAIVRADGQLERPAIVYFEDLHWLDAASDAYLAEIIAATATTRGLVLVNFRPEYRAAWMQTPSYQQLPLVPLDAGAVRDLLADILGNDASVVDLAPFVHQRAAGNPFFVEEIVQTLIETGALAGTRGAYRLVHGVAELEIPVTVHAVLAARIDRLPERDKRVLQQASVIGKTFQARLLLRICGLDESSFDAAIHALREAEFLLEAAIHPHVEYAFKHPLTQEVADRSQLSERRAATHAAVARVIEELSADRLDEEAALLAHHWEQAGDAIAAARWHARAARWIGVSNYAEAYAHWRRVVALIPEADDPGDATTLRDEAVHSLLMLGYRVHVPEQDAAAMFAAAKRSAARRGDDAALAILTVTYAAIRQNAGAVDEYLALASEADRIAARSGSRAAHAAVGPDHGYALYYMGRLEESLALFAEVRARSGGDARVGIDLVGFSAWVTSHIFPAWVLVEMGRLDEAETWMRRGIELATEYGPEETRCWAHAGRVFLLDARGEPGPAVLDAGRRAAAAAERSGSTQGRALGHFLSSRALALDGQWTAALAEAEQAIHVSLEQRFCGDFAGPFLAARARALLGVGDARAAAAVSADGIAAAARQGQRVHECEVTIAHVQCQLALVGAEAGALVEPMLARVLHLVDQTGAERWRPHVHAERAALFRLRGDDAAARRELTEAYRLFTATGAGGHADRAAVVLAQVTG